MSATVVSTNMASATTHGDGYGDGQYLRFVDDDDDNDLDGGIFYVGEQRSSR